MKRLLAVLLIQFFCFTGVYAKQVNKNNGTHPAIKIVDFEEFHSWDKKKKIKYIKELKALVVKMSKLKSFKGTYAIANPLQERLEGLFSFLFNEANAAERSDLFSSPFAVQSMGGEPWSPEAIRRKGGLCIYAGQVINYKGTAPKQCYPTAAENKFPMGKELTLACSNPALRMCSPLLFGVKGNNEPHCVSRTSKDSSLITERCASSAKGNEADVVAFLEKNADVVRDRWNEMRNNFSAFCAKNEKEEYVMAALQPKECRILEERMAALYKVEPSAEKQPEITYYEEFPKNCVHLSADIERGESSFCSACSFSTRHGYPASGRWIKLADRVEDVCGEKGLAEKMVRGFGACNESEYKIDEKGSSDYAKFGISEDQIKAKYCGENFAKSLKNFGSEANGETKAALDLIKKAMVKSLNEKRMTHTYDIKVKKQKGGKVNQPHYDFIENYRRESIKVADGIDPPKPYTYDDFISGLVATKAPASTNGGGAQTLDRFNNDDRDVLEKMAKVDEYVNGKMGPTLDLGKGGTVNSFGDRSNIKKKMKDSKFLAGLFEEIKGQLGANKGKIPDGYETNYEKYQSCEKSALAKAKEISDKMSGDCEMRTAGNPPKGLEEHFKNGQVYVKKFDVGGKEHCQLIYGNGKEGLKVIQQENRSNEYTKEADRADYKYMYCPYKEGVEGAGAASGGASGAQ